MNSIKRNPWFSAYGVSIIIHSAVLMVLLVFGTNQNKIGTEDLISIDLVGSGGGETGGLGQKELSGSKGDGGTNGDNHRLSSYHPNELISNKNLQERSQTGLKSQTQPSKSYGEVQENKENFIAQASNIKDQSTAQVVESPAKQFNITPKKEPKTKILNEKNNDHSSKNQKINGERNIQKISQHTAKQGKNDGEDNSSSSGIGGIAGSIGNYTRHEVKEVSGLGNNVSSASGTGTYLSNGDGTFTAMSAKGLNYKILFEQPAKYPRQAKAIGYSKQVKVTIRFLVGTDGKVEKTEVLSRNIPDLGFEEAALMSIRSIQFAPIKTSTQQPLKVWFKKTIIFKQ